jgi:glutamine cyclotransferase
MTRRGEVQGWRRFRLVLGWALALAGGRLAAADEIASYTYKVVHTYPHDRAAFTEGLVFTRGHLIESTGLYGHSHLRVVDLPTGKVLREITLSDQVFGEGATVLGDRIYQLTWKTGRAFVYDLDTLARVAEHTYSGEGWGLTTDGTSLILSDGSSRLRYLDPATFAVTRTLAVTVRGQPLEQLNELEYIQGEIFANVWQTQFVVRIDPRSGRVVGSVSLVGLLPAAERQPDTDVLNGIAYDPQGARIFVTGKNWPHLYEVQLVRATP